MGKHAEEGRGARSHTYTFSFAVTRTDPEELEHTKLSWLRTLKPVDLMILGALGVVFALEPFAIYMLLTHYRGPLLAERCTDGSRVVVAQYPEPAGSIHEPYNPQDQEVVTPLNVRDPSSLVMGPAPAYEYTPPKRRQVAASAAWKEAIAVAAAKAEKAEAAKPVEAEKAEAPSE